MKTFMPFRFFCFFCTSVGVDSSIPSLYSVIQKAGLNFVSVYFKISFWLYIDSLFAQIGDSNDKCCSSLEVECWNEDETHAVRQSPIHF